MWPVIITVTSGESLHLGTGITWSSSRKVGCHSSSSHCWEI